MTTATQNEYSNAAEPVLFRAVALSDNTWKLGFRIGHGHKPRTRTMAEDLAMVQHLREGDVRALHCVQLRAQRILLAQTGQNPIVNWLLPKALPLLVHSPLIPRVQRRVFVGHRCHHLIRPSIFAPRDNAVRSS